MMLQNGSVQNNVYLLSIDIPCDRIHSKEISLELIGNWERGIETSRTLEKYMLDFTKIKSVAWGNTKLQIKTLR